MRREQIIPEQVQSMIDLIESQELILAEVQLDEITAMPEYNQVLRVRDNNIALSVGYLKIIPKRILVHKTTGEEIDLNLPVPNWEKKDTDEAALLDETGERILIPTNYYDDVVVDEETGETEEQLVETKNEVVLVPILKYLMMMVKEKKYYEIFQLFTNQYVDDIKAEDADYFKRLR